MAKFKTPKDCPGVTLLNVFYPTVEGVVDIPGHINHRLESQGFTRVDEAAVAKSVAMPENKIAGTGDNTVKSVD